MQEIKHSELVAFLARQDERDARTERRNGLVIDALVDVVTALDRLTVAINRWREGEG